MKTETTILRWARGLTDRQLLDQARWQQRNITYNRRRLWSCRFDGERDRWYHEIIQALCIPASL